MFSRRLATFLLGIWIGCCFLIDLQALQGHRIAARILDNPDTDLTKVAPYLHHLASEQTRANLDNWETAQLVLALGISVLLVFTDQRKPLAIALCGAMTVVVLLQHFAVTPELNALGRSSDFLAEAASLGARAQMWTLTQIYGALETLKLIMGGVLASYFFAMESTVKRSKSRRTRATDELTRASGNA